MKKSIACVVFGAVACASAVWAADAPAKSPQEIVTAREAAMKQMGGDLKAASDPATKPADAKAKLADAIKIAEAIPSYFPKGTGLGDPGVTKTRALQDIWAKPADFKAAAEALVAALKDADAALDTGDKAKIDAAFGAVGKSCGGCHKPFRGKEVE